MGSTAFEVFSYFGISEVGSIQGKHVLSQTKLKLNNPFQLVSSEFIAWKLRVFLVFFVVSNIKHSC